MQILILDEHPNTIIYKHNITYHLCHERGHAFLHRIASPDSGQDAICHREGGAVAGHEATHLRQHGDAAHRTDVRTLATLEKQHTERKIF